jgi:proline iminopeptidase
MLAVMISGHKSDAGGHLIPVRGTRLFVEVYGDPGAPAVLYLHGGPGMSCHEFTQWQSTALGRGLRLIALDQRGVLRSDPIGADEPISEDLLVEDCEALREALGLESWALLGHSFGGRLALRYAHRYPDRITSVLFENPAWDVAATERFRLPALAALYDSLGEPALAQECRDLAVSPNVFAKGYRLDLLAGLDERGAGWYLADQKSLPRMRQASPERPDEDHTIIAAMRLINDPGFYESLLPLLPGLRMPALLILGGSDLVTTPEQADAFRSLVPDGRAEVFDRSAHFVQFEQAEEYSALVTAFVLERRSA